jgi:hypothetical protein
VAEAVHEVGFKELRAALKEVDAAWPKELATFHRDLARWLAPIAQGAATAMGGEQHHFAHDISGQGTQTGARLQVAQEANAAFWGAKKRTGWNRGHGGKAQHPPWVGNAWLPGEAGGPYALNPTIAANIDQIVEKSGQMVDRITRQAFPGGS